MASSTRPTAPESPAPEEVSGRRSPAPAVTRSAGILALLAERGTVSLADISREMSLPRSSTLNLCTAMEETRMVRRVDGGYELGPFVVELGGAYVRGFDVVPEFYRFVTEDEVLANEILHVATLMGTEVLYLARHDGRRRMRLTATIGDRFPASITAVGNALLAELSDAEVRERYRSPEVFETWTQRSVADVDALLEKISECRERGYALDDRETLPGVVGVAIVLPPLTDGRDPLALGCSLPSGTATPERIETVLHHLRLAQAHLGSPSRIRPRSCGA